MKFSSTAIALCALFTVFCSSATEVTKYTLTIKDTGSAKNLIDHINAMTRHLDVVVTPINGDGPSVECEISTDDLIEALSLALKKNKNIDSNPQITASITIKRNGITSLYTCSFNDARQATSIYFKQGSRFLLGRRILSDANQDRLMLSALACYCAVFAIVVISRLIERFQPV